MDCLDRTNVVQSVIARIMLVRVLRDLGIIGPQEGTGDLEDMFKNNLDCNFWYTNQVSVESIDDCSLSGEENDGLYFFEWSERN